VEFSGWSFLVLAGIIVVALLLRHGGEPGQIVKAMERMTKEYLKSKG
jgi:hypothetical protein